MEATLFSSSKSNFMQEGVAGCRCSVLVSEKEEQSLVSYFLIFKLANFLFLQVARVSVSESSLSEVRRSQSHAILHCLNLFYLMTSDCGW